MRKEAVLALVNSKYHHYFLPIERSIANYTINLNDELKRLGYYTFKPKNSHLSEKKRKGRF